MAKRRVVTAVEWPVNFCREDKDKEQDSYINSAQEVRKKFNPERSLLLLNVEWKCLLNSTDSLRVWLLMYLHKNPD